MQIADTEQSWESEWASYVSQLITSLLSFICHSSRRIQKCFAFFTIRLETLLASHSTKSQSPLGSSAELLGGSLPLCSETRLRGVTAVARGFGGLPRWPLENCSAALSWSSPPGQSSVVMDHGVRATTPVGLSPLVLPGTLTSTAWASQWCGHVLRDLAVPQWYYGKYYLELQDPESLPSLVE